jgi:hypothetical protein
MAKKNRLKDKFLEELAKTPIVQIACEKSGISRQTYYRWRKEDIDFSLEADNALSQGEDLVNDVAESTVIRGVQNRDTGWTKLWLSHRHNKFKKDMMWKKRPERLFDKAKRDAMVQMWFNTPQTISSESLPETPLE